MNIIESEKELITPTGEHKLLVRAYLSGEDRRANRRMILKLNDEGKTAKVEGIEEAENFMIEQIILSIDGKSEDIVNQVLKFKAEDYDFVVDTVNDISRGMTKKKEKISDGSTESFAEGEK